MRIQGKDRGEGGVVDDFDAAVARGQVEVSAGPVEDALVCLDGLVVLGDDAEGGAVDGDEEVVLKSQHDEGKT